MFHVPEKYRYNKGSLRSDSSFGNNGAFEILSESRQGKTLFCIASDGMGWEHVSVHTYEARNNRTLMPTWEEMCQIKRLFWDGEDVVMQLHPAESEYVNQHEHTLHLWRPIAETIPTPPSIMVGVR